MNDNAKRPVDLLLKVRPIDEQNDLYSCTIQSPTSDPVRTGEAYMTLIMALGHVCKDMGGDVESFVAAAGNDMRSIFANREGIGGEVEA